MFNRAMMELYILRDKHKDDNSTVDSIDRIIFEYWKGNPFLDKITPNKNIPSKYCLSC